MKTIEQIPLDEIEAGATLGRDVLDHKGQCLIAAGTRLTPELLARLRRYGVETVPVETLLSPEAAAARRKMIEEQLTSRFRKVGDDPLMRQLKDVLLAHRLDALK